MSSLYTEEISPFLWTLQIIFLSFFFVFDFVNDIFTQELISYSQIK